jgi:hypothetical protein
MVSFLPKQEARLLCVCSWVPPGEVGTMGYLLDSRLRGNDTLGLERQGIGQVIHLAKVFP